MKLLLWLYPSQVNNKGLMPLLMHITLLGNHIKFVTQLYKKTWDKNKQLLNRDLAISYGNPAAT